MNKDIVSTLRTIRPVDGQVVLNCSAEEAEWVWFIEVSHYDRRNFELVVDELTDKTCSVRVRPWSESDLIASGGPAWIAWLLFGSIILVLLVTLWQKFGFGSSLLIA